ncbi:phage tail spike protein [Oenococcus oeni]|uniref:phage tail spike protein n=1 Tax=Oenococcus oeni TaxID=1247 RepID=UPI003EE4DF6F
MAVLYESGTTVSQAVGGGLGFLSDAVGIQVTNSVNGEFYLEMLYPIDSSLSKELLENRLIKADAGTSLKNQLFIIKKVQRFNDGSQSLQTSSGSSVSIPTGIYVYAEQVGLSLTKDISLKQPTVTINNQDATGALTVWKNNLAINTPFVVDSDIATQNSTAFTLADFQHASDALAGTTGSILDVWGGEYKFDNYHISLLQRMGKTVNGILSYGRNIQTIEQESDISTIYNSIIPYATVSQPSGDSSVDIIHVLSGSDYIQAGSYANQYPYPITLPVDFSDQFYASDASADEKQGKYAYSDAQLKALAQKYLSDNEVGKPTANMTVTAIDLSKSLEYQGTNEQPIELGDIVPTNYEPLAISGTAEVTQTIWDDITKQYVEYTFGQKQTLTSAMVSIADNAVSGVQKQVTAINTIINGLGQLDSYSDDPTAGYPADPVLGQKFFLTDGNNQYIYQYSYDDVTGTYYWKELVSTYTGQEIDNKVSSVVSDAKSYTDDLNDSLTPQIAAIDSEASNAVVGAQTANNNVNSLSSATDVATSQANSNASQAINQASNAFSAASTAMITATGASSNASQASQAANNALTSAGVAINSASAALAGLNNLQVGGRNYSTGTSNSQVVTGTNAANQTSNAYKTSLTSGQMFTQWGVDAPFTISFDYTVTVPSGSTLSGTLIPQWNNTPWVLGGETITIETSGHYSFTGAVASNWSGTSATIVGLRFDNFVGTITITNWKFEQGNKATDWSPAPEDVQSQITSNASMIATKVSQADFNTLNGTVSAQGTAITQTQSEVALKAEQSTVDTLSSAVSTQDTQISLNTSEIALKASQADVDTLTGRVSDAETDITQNASEIATKASQSTVDSLSGTIDSQGTQIIQNASMIATKAESATVNSLGSEVSSQASWIAQTPSLFATKVTETVASQANSTASIAQASAESAVASASSALSNAVVASQAASSANTTASGASSNASTATSNATKAVTSASAALASAALASSAASSAVAAANANSAAVTSYATELTQTQSEVALKADQTSLNSLGNTVASNSAQIAVNANSIQDTVTSINNLQVGGTNLLTGTSSSLQSKTITTDTYWGDTNRYQDIPISIGQIYTFRVWLQCSTKNVVAHVKWLNSSKSEIAEFNGNQIALGDTGGYSTVTTGTAPANAVYARVETVRFPDDNGAAGDVVSYKEEKFEIGNMPTAWSPAPEDMATEADLLITSSEVATKVSEADFSTYQTQTASAIAAKVSNDSFASYQQQVANGFSQTVSTSTFNTLQTQVNNLGQTNLIANSDFNPDIGGWITWQNATLGTVLSNLHNLSSKNVMEITASTTGMGPRVISQPIPINSLDGLTSPIVSLSFAYYVFTGSTNYFRIQYLDDAGTDMGYAGAVALSGSGWQAYVLQNITLTIPTGATHIALLFDARANGKLGIAMPMLVNGSTIGSYVPGPYVGQTTAQTSAMSTINQDLTSITDFVTDGNGNMGTGLLTALEATTLMQGLDGTKSIMSQTSAAWTVALQNTGAPNLLANTSDMTDLTGWGSSTANDVSIVKHSFYANGTRNLFKLSTTGIGEVYLTSDRIPLTGGATYTVQLKAFHNSAQTSMDIYLLTRSASSTNAYDHVQSKQNLVPSVSAINEYTVTITVPADVASGYVRIDNNGSSTSGTSADLYVTEIKLAQESIASPYSSKPIDGNSLLAQINVQAGTTLIQNDKLYLNASSIVFGGTAFINDAMVTDLSASKLTAGTIDASKITVINLDANNISANASAFFTTQWESNYGQNLSITASEIDFITSSNTAKINSSGFTVYQGSGQFGFNVTKWGDSLGGTTSSYGTYMGTYTSNGFLAFTGNGIGSTLVWMDSGMSKGSQVGELGAWNFYRDVLIAPDASNVNQSRQLSFFGTNYGIKADNQHSSLNFYTQNHFWFSHKIVVNGSVASTSLLSLKTIIGEMGTTEAIDDILATDIEKYYFNDDPDQVTQLSPIIDDVNTTPKYSIPAIINNGDSVNIYAMASLSFLAIKQLVAELGDYTIKGTTLLDGKNVKANSMSVNSLDANYIAVNNGILNLSSSDKTSVVQINSGSVLIQQNTSAGVLDGQMLINAYSFSVFYGSNLMTMEADGIHMKDENSLLYTNFYNDYIELSAAQSSTQAISVGGLITTYDSTNGGGVFLIANTPGMGGTTHNSSSGNYWNAANVGLAYRNSTTDENSVGFALRYNVTGQTIYINSTDVVFSDSAGTGNGKIHFGTAGSAYGIQVDSTGASMNFYSSDHFWFNKKIEVVSTTYTSLLSKKNVLGEYKYDALNEINKTDIRLIKFKSQPNDKEHLTAIIDDVNEQSKYYLPSIMKDDGGVDLYSAVSLTFLAIKKEDSKVEKLKKRVNELENQVKMLQSA